VVADETPVSRVIPWCFVTGVEIIVQHG